MTEQEITKQIRKEERHIKSCKEKIEEIEADIDATNRAIAFWKGRLKDAKAKRSV